MTLEHAEQDVLQLAQRWAAAEEQSDVAFLADTLAEDFLGIGPRGFMLTKPEWIGRHASGTLHYESLAWNEARVRLYGDAAIVTGHETDTLVYDGHPMQGDYRATLVFVAQEGRWRLASLQYSPIAPPLMASAQPQ